MNLIKRLYDWVLHWAETPYAIPALVAISFAESSFFPVPPDVLLIPLCLGMRKRSMQFALYCTLASVIGGLFGYMLGWGFYETVGTRIVRLYHAEALFKQLCTQFNAYSFWAVFIPALTPIPYKIFTISSGVTGISIGTFVIASVLGRGLRFFGVAILLWFFGKPIKTFIDKYFNALSIIFVIFLIAGFAAVKFLL